MIHLLGLKDVDVDLAPLRNALLLLKPTGKDGFEGLLALALARITGTPMRLAASGFQFGMDGQGEGSFTPVCFEAKRYGDNLGREAVITKIADLSRRKDEAEILWVLGATTEVPNQLAQDLRDDGIEQGIATLVLDWNDQTLPSLAVTLANAGYDIAGWISKRSKASLDAKELATILDHLRTDPAAQARWKNLAREFLASEISTKHAVLANKIWLRSTLSSQNNARARLGQPTVPKQPDVPVLARQTLRDAIGQGLSSDSTCIVLGGEGVGKSWVAADFALEFRGFSLILGAEKLEGVKTTDLEAMLVQEFAAQNENGDASLPRWQRRLKAWENSSPAEGFIVVVDGINQRPSIAWDRVLTILEGYLEDRGGKLIVTSRPRFYERNVQKGFDRKHKVSLGNWSGPERNQILNKAGIDHRALDSTALDSLLNPRLLGIAIAVLPTNKPDAWAGLTVEGLLFEHIRMTQVDGFEDQSPEELCDVLSRDAGRILDTLSQNPSDVRSIVLEADVKAVYETRFFQSTKGPGGGYKLNDEGLTLALGFAVVDRVWTAGPDDGQLSATIEALLEPISALDLTSRVVLAALHISAFDQERFNPSIFAGLVSAFCELQNLDEDAYPQFFNVVRCKPEATLEAAKAKLLEWRNPINERWLVCAIQQLFAENATKPVVSLAVHDWLRHVNIDASDQHTKYGRRDQKDEEREKARQQEIDTAIAAFSQHEQEVFKRCRIAKGDTDALLTQSLRLLAGEPLAPWAESLTALVFGFHLDHSIHQARKSFDQLTQFNRIDPVEAGHALLTAAEPFRSNETSRAGKWTLVRMLYATGHPDHANESKAIADELRKDWPDLSSFSRREQLCATDPCNPASGRPDNIDDTIRMYESLDIEKMLSFMGHAKEDWDREDALCAMSRFAPNSAILKNRELCQSILTRDGLPLRQIALNGTSLAPLLDRDHSLGLSARLREGTELDTLPKQDVKIVKCYMLMFALPQLSGDEQLELMTSESIAGNYSLDCIPSLKRPSQAVLLAKLSAARVQNDSQVAFGALSLVAHTYDVISAELENAVASFMSSDNSLVRAVVFEIALNTKNKRLRQQHLESKWHANEGVSPKTYESSNGSALLIDAVADGEAKFEEIVARISPESWYHAEQLLGGDIANVILTMFDERLRDAAEKSVDLTPPPIEVSLAPHDLVSHSFRSATEREPSATTNRNSRSIFSNDETEDEFNKRQERVHRLFDELEKSLSEKQLLILTEQIEFDSLLEMLAGREQLAREWMGLLSDLPKQQFAWFKDLAFVVSVANMNGDEERAAGLLEKAIQSDAYVKHVYSDGLSLEHKAVWSCPQTPGIEALWKSRLSHCKTDDALAREVLAAERFGGRKFIWDHANELFASERPIDVALGATIAGFSKQIDAFKPMLDSQDTGVGFLSEAAKAGKKAQERVAWSEHWIKKMWSAEAPEDFWLNQNLVAKIIDARSEYSHEIYRSQNQWSSFSTIFTRSRRDRIKKWQKERAKTLYGSETPDEIFLVH